MSLLRGGRSAGRSRGRSAKFELILTTRCQYWRGRIHLVPNLNSSWPLDVSTKLRGRSAKFALLDLGVDLPNLNSSWPLDVSTREGRSGGRSRGRSAKFELILTTRCQYWGVVDLAGRSRGRSAKFELILTTRCQYWRVDVPNLNSSWPLDVSTVG